VANDGFLLGYPFFVIDDNISSSINPVSVSLLIGLSPDFRNFFIELTYLLFFYKIF